MNNIPLASEATIFDVMQRYLDDISLSRSENTTRTYKNALSAFADMLFENDLSPETNNIIQLPEDAISWFSGYLRPYSASTERLYLTAVTGFYEYLAAERLSEPNLPRVRLLVKQKARRPGQRLPQFPRVSIEKIVNYVTSDHGPMVGKSDADIMIRLRNRAFILTLADTGLRVHEACNLKRGDLSWEETKAVVIGKGNRQDVVRFSKRALDGLRQYIQARGTIDGASGKPLTSLPLFARHDKGAGKNVKPITTTTGRNIVQLVVRQVLGEEAVGTITPHSFRHYFVTTVLRGSGGNLKMAQELARHKNIQVTQRYAHLSNDELDRGYYEIFDE